MDITKILVACYKKDFWQAKVCITSIRYWYPNIPISLLVDELAGHFETFDIEKRFSVKRLSLEKKYFGWGLSKLEPLFMHESAGRFLILDSDTIFIGPVLDKLNKYNANIIVSPEYSDLDLRSDWMKNNYYDYDKLIEFDSKFKFPGYTYNSGQFVANAGCFERNDFKDLLDYSSSRSITPELMRSDIFKSPDQGILNYFLNSKAQDGLLSIEKVNFMIWSGDTSRLEELNIEKIKSKEGYPFIIHYAGRTKLPLNKFDNIGFYTFFLKMYYKTQSLGSIKLFVFKLKMLYKYNRLRKPVGFFVQTIIKRIPQVY